MNGLFHISTQLLGQVLAQVPSAADATVTSAKGDPTAYRPFITSLPIWDYWYLLLLPLCVGVSIVYKSIKCRSMSDVPKQAFLITLWILGGMVAAAIVLGVIVKVF